MSRPVTLHSGEDAAVIGQAGAKWVAGGVTVPSDGAAGYATGCIFVHVDGGVGTSNYVNEGTSASADFNAVQPGAAGGSFAADVVLADDVDLVLGTGEDTLLRWSTGDASDHSAVLALGDTSQMLHITDKAAVATDWAISSPTHPTVYVHSNTTPTTDYMSVGGHDGTSGHINVAGGTLSLDIAGTAEVILSSTALSPATSDSNALGTTALMWSDLFLASGSVVNFDNGDVTITHSANTITVAGGTLACSGAITGATSLTLGVAAGATGDLVFNGTTSGVVTVTVADAAGTWQLTLPADDGDAGEQLQTNGSGVTTWEAAGSMRAFKHLLGQFNPAEALQAVASVPLHRFKYKRPEESDVRLTTTGDFSTEYVGIVADEAPFLMHHKGRILNPINTVGYLTGAIQALLAKVESLEARLAAE
jgi:hypothetical protein